MFKPVFLKQFGQIHFLKSLDIFMRLLKYAKKVTLRDAKEDVDKICIDVRKTSDNAGWKPTRGFSLQHKTFIALNYAQDFGNTVKESLKKNYEFEVDYTQEKSNCPASKTIMPLSTLSTMPLPSAQTVVEFTNCIPKIIVQFYYLRLYFGIDNISRRLLQWIARIKNGLKLRPTTRYWTYSNQISTRLISIR